MIDRGGVENISRRSQPRWIENLSRIYRPDRKFLDGLKKPSRFYQQELQKSRWIKIALTIVEKRRKRGSIEESLSRIYQKDVELEEKEFSKKGKTQEMNATSKLLKHRSNQHNKLSKTSLNKKNAKHS